MAVGSLTEKPLVQVLAYICRKKMTGTLLVRDFEYKQFKVYFFEGAPSYVEGDAVRHALGSIFAEVGLFGSDDLQKFIRESGEHRDLLGHVLVTRGLIDQKQLDTALRAQTKYRLRDLCAVRDGVFEFYPDENRTGFFVDKMQQANLLSFLPELVRTSLNDAMLVQKLEEMKAYAFTVPDFKGVRAALGWNKNELGALDLVGEGRWTLKTVEAKSRERLRHVRIVLYCLLLMGMLRFEEEEEAAGAAVSKDEGEKEKEKALLERMQFKLEQLEKASYFDVLEVGFHATLDEIRTGYLKLRKEWHPDRVAVFANPKLKDGFEKISMKIKEAVEVLSSSEERERYVAKIRGDLPAPQASEEERIVKKTLDNELAYQKALILVNRKKWEEVVQIMAPVLAEGTDNGEYLAVAAWAKVCMTPERESIKEHITTLRNAATVSPRSERVQFFLALALQRDGQQAEYERHLAITAELNPHNMEAQRRLHVLATQKQKKGDDQAGIGGKLINIFRKSSPPRRPTR